MLDSIKRTVHLSEQALATSNLKETFHDLQPLPQWR
jgi:hypothetical protein